MKFSIYVIILILISSIVPQSLATSINGNFELDKELKLNEEEIEYLDKPVFWFVMK